MFWFVSVHSYMIISLLKLLCSWINIPNHEHILRSGRQSLVLELQSWCLGADFISCRILKPSMQWEFMSQDINLLDFFYDTSFKINKVIYLQPHRQKFNNFSLLLQPLLNTHTCVSTIASQSPSQPAPETFTGQQPPGLAIIFNLLLALQ